MWHRRSGRSPSADPATAGRAGPLTVNRHSCVAWNRSGPLASSRMIAVPAPVARSEVNGTVLAPGASVALSLSGPVRVTGPSRVIWTVRLAGRQVDDCAAAPPAAPRRRVRGTGAATPRRSAGRAPRVSRGRADAAACQATAISRTWPLKSRISMGMVAMPSGPACTGGDEQRHRAGSGCRARWPNRLRPGSARSPRRLRGAIAGPSRHGYQGPHAAAE